MYGYIYKTTNLITNKIYIGQKHSNLFLGDKYLGSGKRLRDSIKHYGKENFKVELIEEIESKDLMDEREIYWISYYKSTDTEIGYNISQGGNVNRTMVGENNPFYGKHHSEEQRLIWSTTRKGQKHRPHTEEEKLKIGISNKGKVLSEETKLKISKNNKRARLGVKLSDDTKLKLSLAKKGKVTKAKNCVYITNDITSKRVPEEEVQTYIEQGWRRGRKKFSEQACKNISTGHKGQKAPNKNTKWMNNTKINKCVKLEEIENYLNDGWQLGMLK